MSVREDRQCAILRWIHWYSRTDTGNICHIGCRRYFVSYFTCIAYLGKKILSGFYRVCVLHLHKPQLHKRVGFSILIGSFHWHLFLMEQKENIYKQNCLLNIFYEEQQLVSNWLELGVSQYTGIVKNNDIRNCDYWYCVKTAHMIIL